MRDFKTWQRTGTKSIPGQQAYEYELFETFVLEQLHQAKQSVSCGIATRKFQEFIVYSGKNVELWPTHCDECLKTFKRKHNPEFKLRIEHSDHVRPRLRITFPKNHHGKCCIL